MVNNTNTIKQLQRSESVESEVDVESVQRTPAMHAGPHKPDLRALRGLQVKEINSK